MKKYVLALDQGTTSSRTIVFDKKGRIVSKAQYEFEQIYPNTGWVEHNPYEILDSQLRSLSAAIEYGKINPKEIAAIDEYCTRFKVSSRSALIRQAVMEHILKSLDENHPSLF